MSIEIKIFRPQDQKIKALLYGRPGSGKTTFIGTANKVLVGNLESGLLSIKKDVPYVDIKSIKDLAEVYDFLKKGEHEYEVFALDSLTELNDILEGQIKKKNDGKMGYDGRGEHKDRLTELLKKFRDLPMHIIFVAQEKTMIDGEDIKYFLPNIAGSTVRKAPGYFDIVGRMTVDEKDQHQLVVGSRHNAFTKSRGDYVTDETPMDFEERIKAFKAIDAGEEKIVGNHEIKTAFEIITEEAKVPKGFIERAEKTWKALEKVSKVEKELDAKIIEIKAQIDQAGNIFDDKQKKIYYKFIDLAHKTLAGQSK